MNKPRVMSLGFGSFGVNSCTDSFSTQRKAEGIREKRRFFINHREKQRKEEDYFLNTEEQRNRDDVLESWSVGVLECWSAGVLE